MPEPGPGEILVRVEAVGICASDLKCYHGAAKFWGDDNRPAWAETEVIPGHEFAGEVVELDDAARRALGYRRRRPGGLRADRAVLGVPLLPARAVPHVPAPRHLRLQAPHPGGDGATTWSTRSSRWSTGSPRTSPPAHAAFAEPLACSLHAVERADIRFGDVVVVAGCGPIGLGMVAGAAAKHPGHVVALDLEDQQARPGTACGADTTVNIGEEDPTEHVKR